jgi:hypothetical protein
MPVTVPLILPNPDTVLQATPWIASRYADEPGLVRRVLPVLCLLLGDTLADSPHAARPLAPLTADFDEDDWHLFAVMAEGERIAPLLYWLFTQTGSHHELPEPVWNRLQTVAQAVAVRNMRYFQVLDQILDLLAQHGIEAIVLKGPALAKTIYPNPLLRPMSDLDILVRREDVTKAVDLFISQGWKRHITFSNGFQAVVGPNIPLDSPAHLYPPLLLELHWVLVGTRYNQRAEPPDWAWRSGREYPFRFSGTGQGKVTQLLNPVAATLYVAGHGYWRHRYDDRSLSTVWDAARSASLVLNETDGAERLIANSAETGWSTPLRAALEDAAGAFGLVWPERLLAGLQANEDAYSRHYLAMKNDPDDSMTTDVALPLFMRLNWPGRIRFLAALIWPSRAYLADRYSDTPSPVPLHLRWWLEMTGDTARFVIRRVRRVFSREV